MKKALLFLLLIVTCVSCAKKKHTCESEEKISPLPEYSSTSVPSSQLSSIRGKVIGPDKAPLPFATVVAKNVTSPIYGAYTDVDGNFLISGLPIGEYYITVSLVGYVQQVFGPLKITEAKEINFELMETEELPVILLKPVIYLYPTEQINAHVMLDYPGELIHTYPRYSADGWSVTAMPGGTLIDKGGRSYYALYWEGDQSRESAELPENGQVIAGSESISFLEKNLELLGLSERESNEFIMFWLPQMEKNPYNLIHFSTDKYMEEVPLQITPAPDEMIRLKMTLIPLQQPITYPLQVIERNSSTRGGFTVVEWGGTIMSLENLDK